MKNRISLSYVFLIAVCCVVATGCGDQTWEGTSTNEKGDFNYGPVTFTVKGDQIVDFKIEKVTTSGCGGMKNVLVPSGITIKVSEFGGSYQPVPGIDDTVIVTGTIQDGTITGKFSEGPTCRNSGKFTAQRR